jgi:hypothetical protein
VIAATDMEDRVEALIQRGNDVVKKAGAAARGWAEEGHSDRPERRGVTDPSVG